MKRSNYTGPRPGRSRGQNSHKSYRAWHREGHIDLLSAAPEIVGRTALSNSGRHPAIRTGGRIRMDAPSTTLSIDRYRPIPKAPRYRKNTKPTDWTKVVLGSLFGLAALAGLVWLLTTPKLDVRSVTVEGVSPQVAAQIAGSLPNDPRGQNMFAYIILHGKSLARYVVKSQPNFASASIGLRLPGTVTINVVDRKPFALLSTGPGTSWILDNRGVPIFPGAGHPKWLTKILIKPTPNDAPWSPVLGSALPPQQTAEVAQAYSLMDALKTAHPSVQTHLIQVDKSLNVGLNMSNNLLIKLGQSNELTTKLALVSLILSQHPEFADSAKYIDVSNPAYPAMMPKTAAPQTVLSSSTGQKSG